jgi:two-component system torCAD operon response regulator TorR
METMINRERHHILVVEDEPIMQTLLTGYLEKVGYIVSRANCDTSMWAVLTTQPVDLILMDVNLPGGQDGFSLALEVRKQSSIGIIMLTARRDDMDRILGLELGADDYVTKPFNERELLARVKNILRRAPQKTPAMPQSNTTQKTIPDLHEKVYSFHGWTFLPTKQLLVGQNGVEIHLTNGEMQLLNLFIKHPNQIIPRAKLLNAMSNRKFVRNNRTIDVMISRLRNKVETNPKQPSILITVHGAGYLFSTTGS